MARSIETTVHVAAVADELWREIGGFGAVGHWHPTLPKVETKVTGQIRGIRHTPGTVRDRLSVLEVSPEQHYYRCTMQSTPLPVADYVGELRIEGDGNQSSWSARVYGVIRRRRESHRHDSGFSQVRPEECAIVLWRSLNLKEAFSTR
jgi:Polyketide cyclase / dehydrase and lipid transport